MAEFNHLDPDPKLLGECGRVDARRLVESDATARTLRDMIAHIYLSSSLTVAEMRAVFTLGLEHGMARSTLRGKGE